MRYRITIQTAAGIETRTAIGNRDALMDAAYDNGALGVTVIPE